MLAAVKRLHRRMFPVRVAPAPVPHADLPAYFVIRAESLTVLEKTANDMTRGGFEPCGALLHFETLKQRTGAIRPEYFAQPMFRRAT